MQIVSSNRRALIRRYAGTPPPPDLYATPRPADGNSPMRRYAGAPLRVYRCIGAGVRRPGSWGGGGAYRYNGVSVRACADRRSGRSAQACAVRGPGAQMYWAPGQHTRDCKKLEGSIGALLRHYADTPIRRFAGRGAGSDRCTGVPVRCIGVGLFMGRCLRAPCNI